MTAMTLARLLPRHPASHADRRTLEFFGVGFTVVGELLPDLAFQFGPHLARTRRADFQLELSAPQAGPREVTVRRADGVAVLHRPLTGWRGATPSLPPFAALADRFSTLPACVMTGKHLAVAITGDTAAERARIGIALSDRGWRMVSGQLLVLDRRTGRSLPFHTPLQLVDGYAEQVAAAHPDPAVCRAGRTTFGEPTVLVRPEAVASIVPLHVDGPPPVLVRICRRTEARATVLPRRSSAQGRVPGKLLLEVPHRHTPDEVAELICAALGSERLPVQRGPEARTTDGAIPFSVPVGADLLGGTACQDVSRMHRAHRAGSIA